MDKEKELERISLERTYSDYEKLDLLKGLFKDELVEKEEPKPSHWPGYYAPEDEEKYFSIANKGDISHCNNLLRTMADRDRYIGISCKTKEEAEFVSRQQKAQLEVIEEISRLNEGWIPDWGNIDHHKWEIYFQHGRNLIEQYWSEVDQGLPDYFQAKTEKVWKQVIKNLGKEKVKLGVWGIGG